MPREQFNDDTQRALFNPDTKRVLMVGGICPECAEMGFETPNQAKVTLAGILSCEGTNCCPAGEKLRADTGHGELSWDGSFILEQGRINVNGATPYWQDTPKHLLACWFGIIHYGDYGGFDTYYLQDCKGGVEGHSDYYILVPRLLIHKTGEIYYCDLAVNLFFQGFEQGSMQIFKSISEVEINPEGEFCLPYDTVIENEHECGVSPYVCRGDGTAIITPWPP